MHVHHHKLVAEPVPHHGQELRLCLQPRGLLAVRARQHGVGGVGKGATVAGVHVLELRAAGREELTLELVQLLERKRIARLRLEAPVSAQQSVQLRHGLREGLARDLCTGLLHPCPDEVRLCRSGVGHVVRAAVELRMSHVRRAKAIGLEEGGGLLLRDRDAEPAGLLEVRRAECLRAHGEVRVPDRVEARRPLLAVGRRVPAGDTHGHALGCGAQAEGVPVLENDLLLHRGVVDRAGIVVRPLATHLLAAHVRGHAHVLALLHPVGDLNADAAANGAGIPDGEVDAEGP
mmetsp:Transcript_22024/g.50322  ORF Transcript_22024/g.50322 Transcript_22024/m.50322 type:complete len:290 (+) Transcript_22024:236-1105(+)